MASKLAYERKERGLKLNYPEAVAIISSYIIEGAKRWKKCSTTYGRCYKILKEDDVMDGVCIYDVYGSS